MCARGQGPGINAMQTMFPINMELGAAMLGAAAPQLPPLASSPPADDGEDWAPRSSPLGKSLSKAAREAAMEIG